MTTVEFNMSIDIEKDGPLWGGQLLQILEPFGQEIARALGDMQERIDCLEAKNKRLRSDLDTERRYRLSAKGMRR